MRYLLGVLFRIILIPIYVLILIIGCIEAVTVVCTFIGMAVIYGWIFKIEYEHPVSGSQILWKKLTKISNSI